MGTGQISVRISDDLKKVIDEIQEENMLDDVSSTVRYLIRFYARYRAVPRDILEELYQTHKSLDR
ncbi:MAG: hypothetical protein ACW99A_04225 [Candidatus Kariarchaeaceae archaeon]|jgi:antitoxin component of RelBE/YafQ-DinJ toxin-antitoxin module